jgi:hypothetical protein
MKPMTNFEIVFFLTATATWTLALCRIFAHLLGA